MSIGFRWKIFLSIIVLVLLVSGSTLWFAQQQIQTTVQNSYERLHQQHLQSFSQRQRARSRRLKVTSRNLAHSVRLIAALDQGDAELVYENALSELTDILKPGSSREEREHRGKNPFQATFFRFFDDRGQLLSAEPELAGPTGRVESDHLERELRRVVPENLSRLSQQEAGYMRLPSPNGSPRLQQIIATKIIDPYNRRVMGVLVIGFPFRFTPLNQSPDDPTMKLGVWHENRLYSNRFSDTAHRVIARNLNHNRDVESPRGNSELRVRLGGVSHLIFVKKLNPNTSFHPAFQVGVFSLAGLREKQRTLSTKILGFGGLALIPAFLLSLWLSKGLTEPLSDLVKATQTIQKGELNVEVPVHNEPEFRQLAGSFNRMTEDLRASRQELVETKEYTENILRSMISTLVVISPEGEIQRVNRALLDLSEYLKDDLIGESFERILADSPYSSLEKLIGAIRQGNAENIEVTYRSKSGDTIPVLFSGSVLTNRRGELEGLVCAAQDISERKHAQHQMLHDSNTDLPNSVKFRQILNERFRDRDETAPVGAILYIQLDQFRLIHNSLGFTISNQLLEAVAERILSQLSADADLARWSEDRLVALAPLDGMNGDVQDLARRLLELMEKPFVINQRRLHTNLSIGIVPSDKNYNNAGMLLRDATTALHQARQKSGNSFETFHPSFHRRIQDRLQLDTELRRAVNNEEFELHYQPILDADSNRLAGFEALVRWPRSDGTRVPPDRFIPLAEETGLILPIGRWVLRRGCDQMARWAKQYDLPDNVALNVNISARQLDRDPLVETVVSSLKKSSLSPNRLRLEITESAIMEQPDTIRPLLEGLQNEGISLSIDDFGTGHSSLSQLQRLPVDALKIDRNFVKRIDQPGAEGRAFVRAILSLANTLDLQVVSEGVETHEQLLELMNLGSDYIQGFYVSEPLPSKEAEQCFRSEEELIPS